MDEIPSSTTHPNWEDYPESTPLKPIDPHIVSQYAEERPSYPRWQKTGDAMQVESTDVPIQNAELMPSSSSQTAYTPFPMAAQCPEDRPSHSWWQKSTYTHADANARSTNARIAAQYAEETMHDDASIRAGCITVSAAHTATRRAEETMATRHPEDTTKLLTLRRSNVDGDFYPQEFGHEEVVETMDKDTSRSSSQEELWKRKALEVSPRRVHPKTPHGSSLGREIRGIAERPGRSLQNARTQQMAEPPRRMNSSEFWQAHPMDELVRLAAELNRHLEVGIPGLTAQRSGPMDERYSP